MNDPILTETTKLLLSFAELFGIIWKVIEQHPNAFSIKEILNQ